MPPESRSRFGFPKRTVVPMSGRGNIPSALRLKALAPQGTMNT